MTGKEHTIVDASMPFVVKCQTSNNDINQLIMVQNLSYFVCIWLMVSCWSDHFVLVVLAKADYYNL